MYTKDGTRKAIITLYVLVLLTLPFTGSALAVLTDCGQLETMCSEGGGCNMTSASACVMQCENIVTGEPSAVYECENLEMH